LPTIQAFMGTVSCCSAPRWRRPLQQRLGPNNNSSHIRAFASETLQLVEIFVAFADMVLEPAGIMPGHVLCLRFLYTIQVIIMLGDEACNHIDRFEDLLSAHHTLYMQLYSRCAKPKLHYMRMLAGQYRKFGRVVTCFSAERHHRASKRMAAYCFRNIGHTLIRRRTMHTILDLQQPEAFCHERLGTMGAPRSQRSRWPLLLRSHGLQGCASSATLRTGGQWLRTGEFVLYRAAAGGGAWAGGLAAEFWQATADGVRDLFMIVRGFRLSVPEATATSWLFQQTLQYHVIHHERIFARAPFVWDGAELRVILPLYTRELYGPPE